MTFSFANNKKEWLIPAGLVVLSLVPAVAGVFRLTQLIGGQLTPENARFFASPGPVVLHIFAVLIYSLLGAFQFAPGFRRRHPGWHRTAGKVLIVAGFLTSLTGLWMTVCYPRIPYDGFVLGVIRLMAGVSMTVFLILGAAAIRRRNFSVHGHWMLRAYALAMGAGTQVFTHLPWALFPEWRGETLRTLCMAAGWLLNMAVAEWVIRRPDLYLKKLKTKVASST